MPSDNNGRSMTDVLRDIVQNIQEIIRSELRLAKIEVTAEVAKGKKSGRLLLAGMATGAYAALFLLLGAMFALSIWWPIWAAALGIGMVMGIVAVIVIAAGRKQLRLIRPVPHHTIENLKESVEW